MTESVDAAVLRSWMRTGLVAGWIAVIGAVVSIIGRLLVQRMSVWVAAVGLIAVVSVIVAYGFLRRVFSDPSLQNRPQIRRLRRLLSIAASAYGAALLSNSFFAARGGKADAPVAFAIASVIIAGIALSIFAAVLIAAGKPKSLI